MSWMFNGASAFDQDLGWCVDSGVLDPDGIGYEFMFAWSGCASTSCGVAQKDANGVCVFSNDTVDAAHRLSGVSAALLVLALAAS